MQKKNQIKNKPKKKVNKLNLWATIVACIAALALICLIAGILFIAQMLSGTPNLSISDFDQSESSIIYDAQGNEIANLGNVIRQNIDFNEIPNCVIDAFVAIEDSRFFEHNGFDLPRFTKAAIKNVLSMSFGEGGSTFTMQLVKNTYFTNDETGEEASRSGLSGIKRKTQEIALAMELENQISKEKIFESYVNKLNFGGDTNIRGIQKASQYYFSKDINKLTISEAALLAGVINAPNAYNPFNQIYKYDSYYSYLDEETDYLKLATERRDTVLYQMYNHGYISKTEYDLARSVKVENQLVNPHSSSKDYDGIPYQAYIDAVIEEVMDLTNLDPYNTTMHIYTYMNPGIQEEMDRIQAGNFEDGYLFYPDDYLEVASVCIENATGHVVGVLGGRNYANGGQLLLNHAIDQYKQPGSTVKPILDYALAFENLGWATDHVLTDKPMWLDEYYGLKVINDSGTYVGDVTLKQALGSSINTCAIQAMQQVVAAKNWEYVVNYAQQLGYNFTLEDINIQYAIGGSTCEVTPYQHASAYAAIMNYGVYNTPHTVSRIEFTNGKSPITVNTQSTQVLSDAAAFLTTELMYSNVKNYGGTYSYVKTEDYPVYGKTGTTDYGSTATDYGIPSGAIKDGWLIAATSEYTTATWVGYEKIVAGQQSYITSDYYYNQRPAGKIAHLILESTVEYGDNPPTKLSKPSGVTSITHVIGTFPYAAVNDEMADNMKTTGYIKSDSAKLVTLPTPTVEDISSFNVTLDSNNVLNFKWAKYPDESKLQVSSGIKDISLKNSSGEVVIAAQGTCLFDYTMLYGPIKYIADISINDQPATTISISENEHSVLLSSIFNNITPGDKIKVEGYYAYENKVATSNKITQNIDTTIKFNVPSKIDEAIKLAEKYPNIIKLNYAETDDLNKINTLTFVDDANPGVNITPGTQLEIDKPNIRYTCTIYTEKKYNLSIHSSKTSNDKSLTLYASGDSDYQFTISPESYENVEIANPGNSDRITFTINENNPPANGSITVSIKSAHISTPTKVEVYIKDAKLSSNVD